MPGPGKVTSIPPGIITRTTALPCLGYRCGMGGGSGSLTCSHQVLNTQGGPGPGHSASFQLCDLGVLISLSGLNVILGSPYDGDRCHLGIQISWKRHRWAEPPGHSVTCKDPYPGPLPCDLEYFCFLCLPPPSCPWQTPALPRGTSSVQASVSPYVTRTKP